MQQSHHSSHNSNSHLSGATMCAKTGDVETTPIMSCDATAETDEWEIVHSPPTTSASGGELLNSAAAIIATAEAERTQYAASESAQICAVLSLAAAEDKSGSGSARAPISLSAVLDKSGSMAGEKLRLVKSTTEFMTKQLSPHDMLGLTAYDDEVETVMPISSMTSNNKLSATSKIKSIHAGATTNLSGGLLQGLQQQVSVAGWANGAAASDGEESTSSSVQAVFLLTDGLPNIGITNANALSNIIKSANNNMPKGQSVRVHTFGFGSDVDPVLLGQLAEAGGGTYYYIESEDQVPAVFGEALGGLLSTSCQNVEVVVTPQHGAVLKAVKADFRQEKQADGSVVIHLGDLYSEEQKDLLLEMEAGPYAQQDSDRMQTLATFTVKYFDVAMGKAQEAHGVLQVNRPDTIDYSEQKTSELVQFHKARVQTSRALQEAQQAADQGDLNSGRLQLETVLGQLRSVRSDNTTYSRHLSSLEGDIESTVSLWSSKTAYERQGKKRAMMLSSEHGKQRSCGKYDGKSACMYSNQMQTLVSMRACDAVIPSAKRKSPPRSAPTSCGLTQSLASCRLQGTEQH